MQQEYECAWICWESVFWLLILQHITGSWSRYGRSEAFAATYSCLLSYIFCFLFKAPIVYYDIMTPFAQKDFKEFKMREVH